jgi:hypothetical protein
MHYVLEKIGEGDWAGILNDFASKEDVYATLKWLVLDGRSLPLGRARDIENNSYLFLMPALYRTEGWAQEYAFLHEGVPYKVTLKSPPFDFGVAVSPSTWVSSDSGEDFKTALRSAFLVHREYVLPLGSGIVAGGELVSIQRGANALRDRKE